jgi:hypothetical protein
LICALALASKNPGLKPVLRNELLFRWPEVQLPLLKQGAPTRFEESAIIPVGMRALTISPPATFVI